MKQKKRNKILIASATILFLLAAASFCLLMLGEKTTVVCYLYDPCGGCDKNEPCKVCEVENFYRAKYKGLLIDAGLGDRVDFALHNTLYEHNREDYLKKIEQYNVPTDTMPVMFIGSTVLIGDSAITQEMVDTIRSLSLIDRIVALSFGLRSDDKAEFTPQDYIVYFKSETCEDCKAAASFFENQLPHSIYQKILIYDIMQQPNSELLHLYGERYNANPDCMIPCVFVNDLCLVGSEEIIMYFEDFVSESSVFSTEVLTVE